MARYLKPDSELGFVEDSAEIEYLKFNNLRHSVLGFMLGDFNEQGVYTISPEIVSELIAMRKYVTDSMENIDVCLSELKLDKQLTFLVTFEGNRATLSLVEQIKFEGNYKINSGAYGNINEYVLDEVETSGEVDHSQIYKRWNIGEFDGSVLDVFNMDEQLIASLFGIVNRFKYLMLSNAILLEKEDEIEECEADYATTLLHCIKGYPKLDKAVNERLKSTFKDRKNIIRLDKPYFAKTVNEVIDSAIEENSSLLTESERKDFNQDKRNARLYRNQKLKQIIETDRAIKPTSQYNDVLNEQVSSSHPIIKTNGKESNLSLAEASSLMARSQKKAEDLAASRAQSLAAGEQKDNSKSRLFNWFKALGLNLFGGNSINQAKETKPTVEPAKVEETAKKEKGGYTPSGVSWAVQYKAPKAAKGGSSKKDVKASKTETKNTSQGRVFSGGYVHQMTSGKNSEHDRSRKFASTPAEEDKAKGKTKKTVKQVQIITTESADLLKAVDDYENARNELNAETLKTPKSSGESPAINEAVQNFELH